MAFGPLDTKDVLNRKKKGDPIYKGKPWNSKGHLPTTLLTKGLVIKVISVILAACKIKKHHKIPSNNGERK